MAVITILACLFAIPCVAAEQEQASEPAQADYETAEQAYLAGMESGFLAGLAAARQTRSSQQKPESLDGMELCQAGSYSGQYSADYERGYREGYDRGLAEGLEQARRDRPGGGVGFALGFFLGLIGVIIAAVI